MRKPTIALAVAAMALAGAYAVSAQQKPAANPAAKVVVYKSPT